MLAEGRSVRTTRGKRMRALLGEAAEADEEFWGQDFFAEEKRDLAYEKSDSETSVYDSDFDEREASSSEENSDEEDEEAAERRRRKKKLMPPGRIKVKKPSKASTAAVGSGSGSGSAAAGRRRREKQNGGHVVGYGVLPPGETRKSSRSSVVEASLRHEQHKKMQEVEQRIRKIKRESDSVGRPKVMDMSMRDLMRESCLVTEQQNAFSLAHLLEREEEAKRRHAMQSRKLYMGPKVRYRSFKGEDGRTHNELVYLDGAEIEEFKPVAGQGHDQGSREKKKPKASSGLLKIKIKKTPSLTKSLY